MTNPSRFCAVVDAPFGAMGIRTEAGLLVELVYLPDSFARHAPQTAVAQQTVQQMQRYFADPTYQFNLPLAAKGTAYQQKVWRAISTIPVGQILTYGQIARHIASAPRAVGQACGANFFPLIIPCHRVTAATGLGGFANQHDETCYQLHIKRWLLKHEGVHGYT